MGEGSNGKFWYRYRNLQAYIYKYKLGMPLQEVLKSGQWSNAGTFFTYYFREIKDSLDLDE